MLNRRLFAKIAAFLPGFAGIPLKAVEPKAPEPPPQMAIVIAMGFEFEGKQYGLGVPVFDPTWIDRPISTLEVTRPTLVRDPRGDYMAPPEQVVRFTDDKLALLIFMLQDLRWSRAETLRMLQNKLPLDDHISHVNTHRDYMAQA